MCYSRHPVSVRASRECETGVLRTIWLSSLRKAKLTASCRCTDHCNIWGSHSGVAKDSKFLGCYGLVDCSALISMSFTLPCRWRYYDALKRRRLYRSTQSDIHECFVMEIRMCMLLLVTRLRNWEGCPCMSTDNSNLSMSENIVGVEACVILYQCCLLVFYGVSSSLILILIYLLTAIGLSPGGSTHLHTNNT